MAKNVKHSGDLTKLPTFDPKDKQLVNVVIETPRGSRNKFAYDDELGIIRLKKVLPAGMDFPYEFGFIPSTKASDGDPLDALLMMDEPAYPGILVRCRLVGIIEGEQTQDGETVRNDRVLAVSELSQQWADVKDVKDVDKKLIKALGDFFVNYHELEKAKFKILAIKGLKDAYKAVQKTRR